MKKGSKVRKCRVCGAKVMWLVPEEDYGILKTYKPVCLPNYGGHDGKGYVCKDHAKK